MTRPLPFGSRFGGAGRRPSPDGQDRRRSIVIAALLLAVLAGTLVVLISSLGGRRGPPPPPLTGEAPLRRSAARFLDSVGVNVHVAYVDTAYARLDEWLALLHSAGIRHVRDGLEPDNPAAATALTKLQAGGVGLTLITSLDRPADQQVAYARATFSSRLDALEAPNEADNQGRADWAPALRAFLPALRASAEQQGPRRPKLLGPSFVHPESRGQVAQLSGDWDAGNLHPYPGGEAPGSNLGEELRRARDGGPPGTPPQATETGYHNALKATSGQPPVSEEAAAAYLPRMALTYFAAGIERTFLYELLDEKPDPGLVEPEQHFGLLRQDLTPKPAFAALRNLMDVVRAGPGGGAAEPREVRVNGPGDLSAMVLRRDDGSSVLALWRSVSVWDTARRAPVAVRPATTEVRFGGRAEGITVHRPTVSGRPETRVASASELRVGVGGDVVLLSYR